MTDAMITGVAHLGIRVRDLDRSRAFYEKLGFRFLFGPAGPEPVAAMEHPGGVEINLVLNASTAEDENVLMDVAEKHAGYTHAALRVRDLDEVVALLHAESIPISGGPNAYPGGARGLFVRDPDRNVIEFYQPGGPSKGS